MEFVSLSISDAIAQIRFERPDEGNSMNLAFGEQLLSAARGCQADPAVRAVVITGAGRHFCLGGDLRAMDEAGDDVQRYLLELTGYLHSAIECFMRMPVPVLAAVNGTAAGAGLGLVAMADLAVADRDAKFVAAYTGVALTPDGGTSTLLTQILGRKVALEFLYTNRSISSGEALAWGLVNRVVDSDALAITVDWAHTLARGPRRSFAGVKKLVGIGSTDLRTHLDREGATIAEQAHSAEGREGIRAFLEKRKPRFL